MASANTSRTDALIDQAFSLTFQEMAELAQRSKGADSAIYLTCLEQRLELHWGRIANWHIQNFKLSEQEGVRRANAEIGKTTKQRIANALSGMLDRDTNEDEERAARARESDLVDSLM